jgi:16S rRNA (guanine(966)-N(2))-methyltransferase RsmD
MRIIRGKYQRRVIQAPAGLPVRPTTDMAKESLFNILNNLISFEEIQVLDLFAGTGNISYEFVSRGSFVTAVDNNFSCIRFIHQTGEKLGMEQLKTVKSDVFQFIPKHHLKYDVIFADPPFDSPDYGKLADLIFDSQLLKTDGILVIEHPISINYKEHPKFTDQRHYGKVNFSFFSNEV